MTLSMLQRMTKKGERAALAAFGLPAQPGLGAVGIKTPTTAPGLPNTPSVTSLPKGGNNEVAAGPKVAFNQGLGASTGADGTGATGGDPVDSGRRQRSVIDRALQRNADDFATSSMPLPGDVVTP